MSKYPTQCLDDWVAEGKSPGDDESECESDSGPDVSLQDFLAGMRPVNIPGGSGGLITDMSGDKQDVDMGEGDSSGARAALSTFPVSTSDVLSRVKQFIPSIAMANDDLTKQLAQEGPTSLDIEVLEDEKAPHIEMNLALGLMESVGEGEGKGEGEEGDHEHEHEIEQMRLPNGQIVCSGAEQSSGNGNGEDGDRILIQEM